MGSGAGGDLPGDLTAAESGMLRAFREGGVYDLRQGDADMDDPHGGHPWGPERTVRARVVCWLLLDGPPALAGRVASLKLVGVRITGTLDLAGGTVLPYVEMTECRFEEDVVLPEARFTTLRLADCAIPRLAAARLRTEGDLHLPRCRFHGGIRLSDARIGTDLMLSQAVIHRDRHGMSLNADGLRVGQDLQADLVETHGEVRLRGARVGVSMSLRGARLVNPYTRHALNAPQLTVGRSLYLTPAGVTGLPGDPPSGLTPPRGIRIRPFTCVGGIRLDDGRFGDALDLEGACFGLTEEQELSLRRIHTPELRFLAERPGGGRVALSGARVDNLVDRASSWPGPGRLHMGGFSYGNLVPRGRFTLAERLEWLAAATAEYNPEPYECLATVLRHGGEDEQAREVLLAKHRHRRETLPLGAKLWGYAQDLAVGYGYRPGRAALWMAFLWAAGTFAFDRAPHLPLRPDEHAPWNPALYSLDVLLPVIDLGQKSFWRMAGGWEWLSTAMILLGWLLATAVAAGTTRLLRRG